ncbi:MAG TPA: hypothetical protein ENK21_05970, partial [Trueperaceae bacterium]|nr:hypothetical protein [Trueperaceae bacterium]
TKEPLPDELLNKLLAQRQFMQANQQMRQLSFGDTDLELHSNYSKDSDGDIVSFVNKFTEKFSI